jgi:Dolichyl-phosphate-mannose-protein mannosyltransferase
MMSFPRQKSIFLMTLLLLFVAMTRLLVMPRMPLNTDEVWSVWQTMGTPLQILQWTPYDWPPLYYQVLGAWRAVAGMDPFVLRYLSLLSFLVGCAALYRVLRRLGEKQAAFLVVPAYAALTYLGILGTEVRGYALLLGLMPVTFWLTLRYFDHPVWRRALLVGIGLATMFYISLSSVGAFLMLGLYTLIIYRRKVWRWWLPGVIAAVLALPEIQAKLSLTVVHTNTTLNLNLPPLPQALFNLYQDFFGIPFILLWSILLFIASVPLLYRLRRVSCLTVALLVWASGGVLLYFSNPLLGFFSPRYGWWVMIGIALWTAYGLARLPRWMPTVAGLALLVMAFSAVPIPQVGDFFPRIGPDLAWLKDHIQSGDVVVVDPKNNCGSPESWDYFERVYFPRGLTFASDVTGSRRVWYVTFNGREDPALKQQVMQDRIPGEFVGPPACLMRLYEAPPDIVGIPFENGMRFHGADILDPSGLIWSGTVIRREGEKVRFRLWWSVDHPVDQDYSVGTYLIHVSGKLIDEVNSAPQVVYPEGAPQQTSQWQPGQYYVEERDLTIRYPSGKWNLGIYLAVYFWQDQHRLSAPGVDDRGLLLVRPVQVMAW